MLEKDLKSSYEKELNLFLLKNNISKNDIKNSIQLFENESILNSNPVPKKLEVVGIVSGIPFDDDFQKKIIKIQSILSRSLGSTLHYNVKAKNLAVEYLILKWPSDNFPEETIERTKDYLTNTKFKKFVFTIVGVQIHQDGCIILQGISEEMSIHKIRKNIIGNIPNLPQKQSNWAHVPLGRFLEPLDNLKKKLLNELLFDLNNDFPTFNTEIKSFHLIQEHRWYMEEISKIYTKKLI